MYVEVTRLPESVQAALKSVDYGRKDIEVRASERVSLGSSSGDGFRAFVALVNLTTGQSTAMYGSWGGANMFNRSNAVDNDFREYPLPGDGVAVTGMTGGGKPTHAVLNVPATMLARMLPSAEGQNLSEAELDALYCHNSIRGGTYRKEALQRLRISSTVVDGLVERGLLSRNKAGATQITTQGKNLAPRDPSKYM